MPAEVLLFGGTFDPPHVGHLMIADLAREQMGVDEVWFLPAPEPPHKPKGLRHSFMTRVRMVDALCEGYPSLYCRPIEAFLPTPSYSVDTVRACRRWWPETRFRFLVGADSLAQLPAWQEAAELVSLLDMVVAVRTDYPIHQVIDDVKQALPAIKLEVLHMPLVDVSSTWIRSRFDAGQSLCEVVPSRVLEIWAVGQKSGELGEKGQDAPKANSRGGTEGAI